MIFEFKKNTKNEVQNLNFLQQLETLNLKLETLLSYQRTTKK